MDFFSAYSLPLQGLKMGLHEYRYVLGEAFFAHFESSLIRQGEVQVVVYVDKRPSLIILDFYVSGYTNTICDRCNAAIQLPLNEESRQLILKYGEAEANENDDEVVFISRDVSDFCLAPYLYEFATLALPMTNTYDCQRETPQPCNQEVLRILETLTPNEQPNPIWESLRNLQ